MIRQEAIAIYMETSIPPGMTMSEYRSSRRRRSSLRRRLTSHLRRSR
jgi:hypothetical protein